MALANDGFREAKIDTEITEAIMSNKLANRIKIAAKRLLSNYDGRLVKPCRVYPECRLHSVFLID